MTIPQYVDYHCHLDLYPNHQKLLEECQTKGVATLAVTTTPKAWEKNIEMAKTYDLIRVALGLHPQLVAQRANELDLFESLLPSARFIGEVGLDAGRRFYYSFNQQQDVFKNILQMCASYQNKILSIHSAYSSKKVLDALETYFFPNRGKVVLHWFSGTTKDLQRAVEMGCYFSVNQEMLMNKKIKSILSEIPLKRLLTETDGPFLEYNKKIIHPIDVQFSVYSLAKHYGENIDYIKKRILTNLYELEN